MSEPADRAGRALLAGALLAYLALSLVCWRSPGQAVGDTLVQETFAVSQIARMEEGRLPQLWSRIYHGNTSGILMVPYLWLFGRDWSVMRSWNVLFGALTLAAGWGLTRRLCGAKAAGLFAVLLAVHPTFVFGTRAGNSHVSLTVFFSLATLYCLARWWDSGGTAPLERRPGSSDGAAPLAAAAFLAGAGLGTRFWFSWFLVALAAAALLYGGGLRRRIAALPPRRRALQAAAAAGAFAAATAPIWLGGLLGHPAFFLPVKGFTRRPELGSEAWGDMLAGSLKSFHEMLDGAAFQQYLFHDGAAPVVNALYPAVFWAALAWTVFLLARRGRGDPLLARAAFPAALLAALLLIGFLTYKTLRRHHLFMAYPLPLIVAAAALARLRGAERGWAKPLSTALFALLVGGDLRACAGAFVSLTHLGAMRMVSDSVYDAARWVRDAAAAGREPLVLGEEDALQPLVPLTRGAGVRFEPVLFFAGRAEPRVEVPSAGDLFPAALQGRLFLVRKRWEEPFPPGYMDAFLREAAGKGVVFRLRRRFFDGDGTLVYEGYAGEPA
jgi:4-amino-4-deoxy-L-arabinose transferase-like glycosyltransferase